MRFQAGFGVSNFPTSKNILYEKLQLRELCNWLGESVLYRHDWPEVALLF